MTAGWTSSSPTITTEIFFSKTAAEKHSMRWGSSRSSPTPTADCPSPAWAWIFVIGTMMANPADRKSTRLNSSHANISYAVFCLKKKKYEQYFDLIQLLQILAVHRA